VTAALSYLDRVIPPIREPFWFTWTHSNQKKGSQS
jgi:hypothetical protein